MGMRSLKLFLWYVLFGSVGKLVITLWLCFYGAEAPMHDNCPTEMWQIAYVPLPLIRSADAETNSYKTVYGTMWTVWDSGHLWASCTGFVGVWALWWAVRLLAKAARWLLGIFGMDLINVIDELRESFREQKKN